CRICSGEGSHFVCSADRCCAHLVAGRALSSSIPPLLGSAAPCGAVGPEKRRPPSCVTNHGPGAEQKGGRLPRRQGKRLAEEAPREDVAYPSGQSSKALSRACAWLPNSPAITPSLA